MIIKIESKNIVYDENYLAKDNVNDFFSPELLHDKGLITGSARGRGITWFVQLDGLQAALRHYYRGGLLGKVMKDCYFYTGLKNTRCFQEFTLLKYLRDNGVNVPIPIAARVSRGVLFYQADLLSEKICEAQDLITILKKGPISSDMYKKIGHEIAKMHNANVNHTDLNIHNILIDNDDKVWIIDFDKCYLSNKRKYKSNNIIRLFRSFRKEIKKRIYTQMKMNFL